MKILILGGYGTFGTRLVRLLSNIGNVSLLIAGRDGAKAKSCAAGLACDAIGIELDRKDIASFLSDHAVDLVIDASGPFQDYGAEGHVVLEACLAHRANYMDLSDSSEFVQTIPKFDERAREAGIFALSGVSTFPTLSMAALRELAHDIALNSVEIGLIPTPSTGLGENVIRAVLSYAGRPIRVKRGGVCRDAPGLAEIRRFTIAPPGADPLPNSLHSLVEVPDTALLPFLLQHANRPPAFSWRNPPFLNFPAPSRRP